MHALVVDDSRTVRKILAAYLVGFGFDVVEAVDGRDGLDCLKRTEKTDLVLVDWNMPVTNGIAFIREVRADAGYDGLPVVMVATNTELANVAEALDAGATEYIMKPCTKAMIREKLELLGFVV
jgi:two-component system, chemotaxis family, chemotaxis protein CheY